MKRKFFILVVSIIATMGLSSCYTATGALIGTGVGLLTGGERGALIGGLIGGGLGIMADNVNPPLYHPPPHHPPPHHPPPHHPLW